MADRPAVLIADTHVLAGRLATLAEMLMGARSKDWPPIGFLLGKPGELQGS